MCVWGVPFERVNEPPLDDEDSHTDKPYKMISKGEEANSRAWLERASGDDAARIAELIKAMNLEVTIDGPVARPMQCARCKGRLSGAAYLCIPRTAQDGLEWIGCGRYCGAACFDASRSLCLVGPDPQVDVWVPTENAIAAREEDDQSDDTEQKIQGRQLAAHVQLVQSSLTHGSTELPRQHDFEICGALC